MIVVDSSVWIDYFRGSSTPQVAKLDTLFADRLVVVGDLIAVEVLQGFRHEREFAGAFVDMMRFDVLVISDMVVAVEAARNFRRLRERGITIRKTIDTLIATRCILDGHTLLYSDRDFDPFVEHLGLQSAMAPLH